MAYEVMFGKEISKSVKCFKEKHKRFGSMTLLKCEENRCTVLRNTIDKNDPSARACDSARKMYIMAQFK